MYYAKRLENGTYMPSCTVSSIIIDKSVGLHYEDYTQENWDDIVQFCDEKNWELNQKSLDKVGFIMDEYVNI